MTRRGRGQAAVESVGITVAVALLVGAMALWMAREVRPPPRPPDVIGRVAEPLGIGSGQGAQAWSPQQLPPWLGAVARGGGGAPLGDALRALGRGVVTTGVLALEGDRGFREGLQARLRERGLEILHDPLGGLTDLPDPALLTPSGLAERVLQQAGDLADYVRMLRRLPPRVAAHRLGRDLGEGTADLAVDVGEAALRRRIARSLGRGRPPEPPRDTGAGAPPP